MEPLRFIIKGQLLKKDPSSDFRNLVAGSSNVYKAEFEFDENWEGFRAVAVFTVGEISETVPIVDGGLIIPTSVLEYKNFTVQVFGKKDDQFLPTTVIKIRQMGGKDDG